MVYQRRMISKGLINRNDWLDDIKFEYEIIEICIPNKMKYLESKWLNGYLKVKKGHPWHNINYGRLNENLTVHGGLTYSSWEDEKAKELWVVGFDCHHLDDKREICNEGYVFNELVALARQAWEACMTNATWNKDD